MGADFQPEFFSPEDRSSPADVRDSRHIRLISVFMENGSFAFGCGIIIMEVIDEFFYPDRTDGGN